MKIRKQVYELTATDLNEFPVWEFALDEEGVVGQDEATVRPHETSGTLDPSDGMYIVRASFLLADGTKAQGYLIPSVQGDNYLGTLQPIIVTATGQIGLWCGMRSPSYDELMQKYRLLGKEANHVFPVQLKSEIDLVDGPVRGSVAGFVMLEDFKTRKIKILT